MTTNQEPRRSGRRQRARRRLVGIAMVVGLIGGPMARLADANGGSVRIFVSGGNLVWAEASVIDTGGRDYWHSAFVEEVPVQPWNLVCGSQGYRDLRLEDSGPDWFYYGGVFSGFQSSCVYGRYVTFPDRTTSESWDMRFAWKSTNTSGMNPAYDDFVNIGTVDA